VGNPPLVMVIPGATPTVEFIVTWNESSVVDPVMNEPAESVWLVCCVAAVLNWLRVTWLRESTDTTVVPAGKFPLVRVIPGRMPWVELMVTTADPGLIVAPPKPGFELVFA